MSKQVDLKKLLENPIHWPAGLKPKTLYCRLQDDHDGSMRGEISVAFGPDGDAWVEFFPPLYGGAIRFRNFFGGGMSPRVYQALLVLGLAIKLDNEENPIRNYTPREFQLELPFETVE